MRRPLNARALFSNRCVAIAVAAAVSQMAQAEQTLPETETLVVEGQATSGLDSLITDAEMEDYQVTDLTDMFRRDPSITAGGSVGMSQKIYLRNLGEDSLHISVDGAEQAAATFHHAGRIAIEPELLKQVEVEAGAGSATAGPGALGGSIRFVTKDPEDMIQPGESVGALLKSSYYSNGDGWKNTATVSAQTDSGQLGGMLSLSDFSYDNMDDGNGDELSGTESDKRLGFAKFVAKPAEGHKLTFSYENLKEEGDINYRPEWANSAPEATDWTRKTSIVNYQYAPQDNDLVDFSLNAYDTESDQSRFYNNTRNPAASDTFGGRIETLGFTLQNKSKLANHQLIYGVNYRDDDNTLYAQTSGTNASESGKVKGVFIQDVYTPTDLWTISAGMRFDKYQLDDANGLSLSDSGFAPNVSANYKLTDGVSLSAGYAEAFRGPEVRDSLRIDSYSNDPNLKGETARNLELGINFEGRDYSAAVGVYHSVIKDAILNGGGIPWNSNYTNSDDDIKTKGLFLKGQKRWDQLTLGLSANLADTEVDGVDASRYMYSSSANSIGHTLTMSLDYQASENLALGWSAEFVKGFTGDTVTINDTDGTTYTLDYKKKGYAVHDIYARWQPMSDEQLTLTLSVNNLFDKQYISHASLEDFTSNPGWENIVGSAESGRDIRLSAALRF